jgi:hypothetical protein
MTLPDGYNTGPVRLRLLRHREQSSDASHSFWCLTIEWEYPFFRLHYEKSPQEPFFGIKDSHTFDIVVEHYKPHTLFAGCNGTIVSIDLFCLARWLK